MMGNNNGKRRPCGGIIVLTTALLCFIFLSMVLKGVFVDQRNVVHRRSLQSSSWHYLDPKTVQRKQILPNHVVNRSHELILGGTNQDFSDALKFDEMPYDLPAWAREWCMAQRLPPIDYDNSCNHSDIVYAIPLAGGLTNSLKAVLWGAIMALDENRCFYLEESQSQLRVRHDPSNEFESFWGRYFAPIGLSKDLVQKALLEGRVRHLHLVTDIFVPSNVRLQGTTYNMTALHYQDMDGHYLKKILMRRLWRPLPHIRQQTCTDLDAKYELHKDFVAFSVRRGDKKSVEHFEYTNLNLYLQKADRVMQLKCFEQEMPKIFVATDDCSVMADFRRFRPQYTFVSVCDYLNATNGFVLSDVKAWTKQETDHHFAKFFVELYALATAKAFVGVAHTNVAYWAYFMRPNRGNFYLLDLGNRTMQLIDSKW